MARWHAPLSINHKTKQLTTVPLRISLYRVWVYTYINTKQQPVYSKKRKYIHSYWRRTSIVRPRIWIGNRDSVSGHLSKLPRLLLLLFQSVLLGFVLAMNFKFPRVYGTGRFFRLHTHSNIIIIIIDVSHLMFLNSKENLFHTDSSEETVHC